MNELTKIILFSGGLDSTYLLYDHVMRKENIYVHHIILKNNTQPRWREELKASRNIVNYLKKYYDHDFTYTESEWSFDSDTVWDAEIETFVAVELVSHINSKKVMYVRGNVRDDLVRNDSLYRATVHSNMEKLWHFGIHKYGDKVIPEVAKPIYHLWKKDIIKKLPVDLYKMIWYCMNPKDGKPCGDCLSCVKHHNAEHGVIYDRDNYTEFKTEHYWEFVEFLKRMRYEQQGGNHELSI
jgi:7-cyano-7-deazaguanine synthase in queuosine biosynthesis